MSNKVSLISMTSGVLRREGNFVERKPLNQRVSILRGELDVMQE